MVTAPAFHSKAPGLIGIGITHMYVSFHLSISAWLKCCQKICFIIII